MKLLNIFKAVATIGPGIKSWIWADGKFKLSRAVVLIAALLILSVMYHYLGDKGVAAVLAHLDEISDIIGYE